MLSERISTLFALLQCNNVDIARYAGCSPSSISHLRTGNREPKPSSRTVAAFAAGVFGYADYENLLPSLCELCGAADTARETVLPALTAWLYGTGTVAPPQHAAVVRFLTEAAGEGGELHQRLFPRRGGRTPEIRIHHGRGIPGRHRGVVSRDALLRGAISDVSAARYFPSSFMTARRPTRIAPSGQNS